MIKSSAGMNHYEEITKKIDKNITEVACHVRGADEYWEHVMFCENNRENI